MSNYYVKYKDRWCRIRRVIEMLGTTDIEIVSGGQNEYLTIDGSNMEFAVGKWPKLDKVNWKTVKMWRGGIYSRP